MLLYNIDPFSVAWESAISIFVRPYLSASIRGAWACMVPCVDVRSSRSNSTHGSFSMGFNHSEARRRSSAVRVWRWRRSRNHQAVRARRATATVVIRRGLSRRLEVRWVCGSELLGRFGSAGEPWLDLGADVGPTCAVVGGDTGSGRLGAGGVSPGAVVAVACASIGPGMLDADGTSGGGGGGVSVCPMRTCLLVL